LCRGVVRVGNLLWRSRLLHLPEWAFLLWQTAIDMLKEGVVS
jgi:hypothetical protein